MNAIEQELITLLSHPDYRVSILSAGNYRFPADYRCETHLHPEIELNYITSGSCIMKVNGTVIPLKRGDCIAIRPFEDHSFLTDIRRSCRIVQLVFRLTLPAVLIEHNRFLAFEQPFWVLDQCESICLLLEQIARAHRASPADAYQRSQLDFSLLQLYAALSGKIRELRRCDSIFEGKLGKALALIELNLQYDIRLEEIAKEAGISSRYLRREFQQKIGMSPAAFLTALRLAKAKELLWNSSKHVQEIAWLTGFGSPQYFCRVFKKQTGMTPFQYRSLWNDEAAERRREAEPGQQRK